MKISSLALSGATVALLLTISIPSIASTRLGCWKGQAWQSTDEGDTWTPAGGLWFIEYAIEADEEVSDVTDGEVFESIEAFIADPLTATSMETWDLEKNMQPVITDRETARQNGRRIGKRNPQTGK